MVNLISYVFRLEGTDGTLLCQKRVEYQLPILPNGSEFLGHFPSCSQYAGRIEGYRWCENTQLEVIVRGPEVKQSQVDFVIKSLESDGYKCFQL